MAVRSDIQKLEPGALVEFYEIDSTSLGGTIDRFHAGVNEKGLDVVWQGQTYLRFPIKAEGFTKTSEGTLPRPVLTVSNVGGFVGALIRPYDDFIGAKVTRKRTFVKYLDAVNFTAGNPSADPNAHFDDEIYYIDRKADENNSYISFELAASWDVAGVKLPRRRVIKTVCPWKYRSSECSYTGGPVATITDEPTTDSNLDQCGKRLSSCALRFSGVLPFGGFPGVTR